MAATAEVLPAGNKWEFSQRNWGTKLQPRYETNEITQPSRRLQEIVQYIQTRFIREGWQFTALVQDLSFPYGADELAYLIVIFTHPSRTALVAEHEDIDQFIKPEVVVVKNGEDDLFFDLSAKDPINQICKGTNRVAVNFRANYNVIAVEGEEGIGQKGILEGKRLVWQTGVGYFEIGFTKPENQLNSIDELIKEHMAIVRPLQEERAALVALQSPNPVALFQTR